jgi:AraC-like DNA-binding protein
VLPPLHGVNVPELSAAMLAVDAELRARPFGGSLLAEVAFRSGFANQSHFCLHFKRITGVTPRRFRENANRKTIPESGGSRRLNNLAL